LPEEDILESYKGTAPYMAPEKNTRKHKRDVRKGDVYSIGVILFYMLYHKYPSEALSEETDAAKGKYVFEFSDIKIDPSVSISIDLLDIMMKCLQKDN